MNKILIFSILLCLFMSEAKAGYWIKTLPVAATSNTSFNSKKDYIFRPASNAANRFANAYPLKHKRKGIAIFLSILAIFPYTAFFGFGGSHRFYMGYVDIGAMQLAGSLSALIAGTILLFLVVLAHITTGPVIFGLALLVAFGAFTYLWQWVDFFRILFNDLQPKHGKWYERHNRDN
jgi:hypothetical protein